ncbi:MAG: hypothetical protein NXH97_00885 [Rhodobacteraceae bacterium]|nr:hypothetical protein [Paracoccaceae bacterium]
MLDGVQSQMDFLSARLAQKHYENLRRHEGDPLDVAWPELPDPQKQIWLATMSDLIRGLTDLEVNALSRAFGGSSSSA